MTSLKNLRITRRDLLRGAGALVLTSAFPTSHGIERSVHLREIPKSGERIPAVGMGTWLTFDVRGNREQLRQRQDVLQRFFDLGGGMIDSSPMYGEAEKNIGILLGRVRQEDSLFAATKIWTMVGEQGPQQIRNSELLWGIKPLNLVHVHNLLNWKAHLKTLRAAQEKGEVRYIGLTTSHGRRHAEMEKLIRNEPVDFVQLTYNVLDREAEQRLLPAAMEQGIAVVINRPFRTGQLFTRLTQKPLPPWAGEIECSSWAEILLKFILSHPAVTCVIPATRRVDHMSENMRAGTGVMPDDAMRKKIVKYISKLY